MTYSRSAGSVPGISTTRETIPSEVRWAASQPFVNWEDNSNVKIDSTVTDTGNTPNTTIRGGQVMAISATDNNYYLYDVDASDGKQEPVGILSRSQDMLDQGVATDTFGPPLVRGGGVKAGEVIGLDANARTILKGKGVIFDDEETTPSAAGGAFLPTYNLPDGTVAKTLTSANNGQLWVANDDAAATTFTLPTIANGLVYEFLQTEDFNLVITSAAGNDIIAFGDKAATTLTFSTAGQLIGSRCELRATYIETGGTNTLRWIFKNLGGTTVTPT